jgi:hypothetical protein
VLNNPSKETNAMYVGSIFLKTVVRNEPLLHKKLGMGLSMCHRVVRSLSLENPFFPAILIAVFEKIEPV